MKKIIAIANQKGGIGKTTTAISVTAILNRLEHKTLLIDCDPSGYATDTFQAEINGVATLYDVIMNERERSPLEEAIQETPCGYIVASDPLLKRADFLCAGDPDAVYSLREAIESAMSRGALDDFEYIIIDSPPLAVTLLNICLIAAEEVVIPVTPDRYAVKGLSDFNNTINAVRKRSNNGLHVFGLLMVMIDPRLKIYKGTKDTLLSFADKLGTVVLPTAIRRSVTAAEAQTARQTLIDFAPGCSTELDYEAFVDLILESEEE